MRKVNRLTWVNHLLIATTLCMFACQKQAGYIYKASYTTPNGWLNDNHTTKSIATNFFTMDVKDSVNAVHHYMETEAYRSAMERGADSLWIEYQCTLEEWRKMDM